MELRFPEEVVAVVADEVEPGEDALVVDAFALEVVEGPLLDGVAEEARRRTG